MGLALVLLLTVAVSLAVSGLLAWAGPVDRPRERGAHVSPTPTAGGLGIMAGAAAGLFAWSVFGGSGGAKIAASLGCAAALGVVGALDDLFDMGAKAKLLIQLSVALAFTVFVARIEALPLTRDFSLPLGPVIGVLGTMLWLLVATNAVNFMDGANGLAAGSLGIVFAAFGAAAFIKGASGLGAAAFIGALAQVGFLPWNFPKAHLFQGDVGALFSSFLLASLAVIGADVRGLGPVFALFAPLALLPFFVDVLLTLLRRARGGRRLMDAHKEHLYQRWFAARGRSHIRLSLRMWSLVGFCSAAALGLNSMGAGAELSGFVLCVLVLSVAWSVFGRRCA